LIWLVNLAWNRALCVDGDSQKEITLPVGYEQVYAILTSQILAFMKETGLEGAKVPLSQTQNEKLAKLTSKAAAWDVSHELCPSMFPDRSIIPRPKRSTTSTVHESVRTSTVSWVQREESFRPNVDSQSLAFADVSDERCRESGLYFKREFKSSPLMPLQHRDQHCCALGCSSYEMMSRVSHNANALNICCQDCNMFACELKTTSFTRNLMAVAAIVESPTKSDAKPAVYTFAI
jgi:hypothetical protein